MKNSTVSFSEILKILVFRRKLSYKKSLNLLKNFYSILTRKERLDSYPSYLIVDPANVCNLRCPLCVETKKDFVVPNAILKKESFFKLVDETGDYLVGVSLYYAGEPFLNKDIFEMIKYVQKKRLYTMISSNLNVPVDDGFAENLIYSGLDILIIAVSGYTTETYGRYHIGGDIELVKRNIKKIQGVKKNKRSMYPKIVIRYLLARYNQEERDDFYHFADTEGVDFFETSLMDFIDKDDPEDLHEKSNDNNLVCWWPCLILAVHSEGTAEPCCNYNYKVPIVGNVFEESVAKVWNSDILQGFRKKMSQGGKNTIECCKKCTIKFGFQRQIVNNSKEK